MRLNELVLEDVSPLGALDSLFHLRVYCCEGSVDIDVAEGLQVPAQFFERFDVALVEGSGVESDNSSYFFEVVAGRS